MSTVWVNRVDLYHELRGAAAGEVLVLSNGIWISTATEKTDHLQCPNSGFSAADSRAGNGCLKNISIRLARSLFWRIRR